MSSFKIKANQAWPTENPLEIWRVSQNEKGETIKEKLNASYLREKLDGVLFSGKVPRNDKNRNALLISLNQASSALSLAPPLPPQKLVKNLRKSIEDLSAQLATLKKYRGAFDVINQVSKSGDGVVDFLPIEASGTFKVV
jgi:hypothetical protein